MFSSRKETFGSPCILVLLNKYTNGRIHRVQLIRHQRFLFLSTYKTADSSGKKKTQGKQTGRVLRLATRGETLLVEQVPSWKNVAVRTLTLTLRARGTRGASAGQNDDDRRAAIN
jgi:hypothetical protein